VVFLHGWGAMQPDVYGAWIEHVVRKGHIVVYPRYQECLPDTPSEIRGAARTAIADAWQRLARAGKIDPRQTGVVWLGHSLGAGLTAILAPQSDALGLPPAAALLLVEPGGRGMDPAEVGELPAQVKVLIVVGEEDRIAGTRTADELVSRLAYLPAGNVETVAVQSERRAFPTLIADHFAPLAFAISFAELLDEAASQRGGLLDGIRRERRADYLPDALDFYGYWKFADGLLDWAYRGENLEFALGDTSPQRFMGLLSNGEPVEPVIIRENE
jgi:pimeloyl-ACP methyl ester carboxylesterase